ncbi:U32 family peptidase C-terminal domain-containing protein [Succinatimonas hippei]|uniref:U32 family peptidase C-terminal domain-containing protein n=1 Tax=Succinatimonas hippei TaxID=626938 RepID=UPI0026F31323|nr:U32 family peptidase C-terminal domain-containing protein [Succinatimonas hippei]
MNKPELLAPAGSFEHLKMAAAYGADAVYAGIPRWSLRVRGNGFTREDFAKGINHLHERGKKFFAVLNVIPHMRRTQSFIPALDEVAALKPDAFIMADPGLIMLARERHPDIPIHLSVQANTVNSGTVKFWQKIGITRCILARELTLQEIAMIRDDCPDMELEVFVHGALCIAVSGRCLISGLLARRDANVGACTNSCRWGYNVRSLYAEIEESSKRQGEWMPIEEDEHGSYLLNSKDLCALPLIKRLMDIGVDSLKIEGRSRSPFYSGAVSRAYRLAIDSIAAGGEIPDESFEIVNSIPSRGYTTGLLEVHRPDETQEYTTNSPTHGNWMIVGAIEEQKDERLYIKVKNRFTKDDKLILFTPKGQILLDGNTMLDKHGKPCELAPGDGYYVSLSLKEPVDISTAVLLRANR